MSTVVITKSARRHHVYLCKSTGSGQKTKVNPHTICRMRTSEDSTR